MHPHADPHAHLDVHRQRRDHAVLRLAADVRPPERCSTVRRRLATSVRRLGDAAWLDGLARWVDCPTASLPAVG